MDGPKDKVLLKTQSNYLFTRLQEWGFSPTDFELTEDSKSNEARLRHRPTDYFFLIVINNRGEYSAFFSPGENIYNEVRPGLNWKAVEVHFKRWMVNLKEEIEAPDLWSAISDDIQLIKLSADQENTPFTPEEQLHVKNALTEIKTYIIEGRQVSEVQTRMIEARLNYLEEAASRLGRKDYIGVVVTTLLTIAYDQGFGSNLTAEIMRFAGQIFKRLLGTMLYLAGPH